MGDSNLASNQFPMCSTQSGTLGEVHRVTQRREERGKRQRWPGEEIEATWWRKRRDKGGESNQVSNLTPK